MSDQLHEKDMSELDCQTTDENLKRLINRKDDIRSILDKTGVVRDEFEREVLHIELEIAEIDETLEEVVRRKAYELRNLRRSNGLSAIQQENLHMLHAMLEPFKTEAERDREQLLLEETGAVSYLYGE